LGLIKVSKETEGMSMLLLLPFLSYSWYVHAGEEKAVVGKGEGKGKNNIIVKKEIVIKASQFFCSMVQR
jgi:hypothetical protein